MAASCLGLGMGATVAWFTVPVVHFTPEQRAEREAERARWREAALEQTHERTLEMFGAASGLFALQGHEIVSVELGRERSEWDEGNGYAILRLRPIAPASGPIFAVRLKATFFDYDGEDSMPIVEGL